MTHSYLARAPYGALFATVLAASLVGCSSEPAYQVTTQAPHVERSSDGEGGFMALEVLATDSDGNAIGCNEGELSVEVQVAGDDGVYATLSPESFRMVCDDGRTGDLAIVVDNSGSEDGYLPLLQQGATEMVSEVTARGGRASLTRVSTEASIVQPMTNDSTALSRAIDDLFINDGWTALYDGVRMGNETLGAAADPNATSDSLDDFCGSERTLGIVTFTDGADNNSSDEHETSYAGDGIDTLYEDLLNLRVAGATTPIYTIGMGGEVDHERLQGLADTTGGRYLHVDSAEQIPEVFGVIGEYFDASHEVCVELPAQECGSYTVRVNTEWTYNGELVSNTSEHTIQMPCDVSPEGRVATILLTTTDPGMDGITAQLTRQTTEWVSPVLRPNVLVVLDDNAHGEDLNNVNVVTSLLADADNNAVHYMDEPDHGLRDRDVEGYDVIWFSNPGYPMDDERTFSTLQRFSAAGGGVVLQGDDMTQSWGGNFSTAPLVHLDPIHNGTQACGQAIDNYRGGQYKVTIAEETHAMTLGLEGTEFLYSNDIDHSTPRDEGEVILATATVNGAESCMAPIPVIVGYTP